MTQSSQLEFCDIHRDRTRPPGKGNVIAGFWVYGTDAQTVGQVAYTLNLTSKNIIEKIEEGAFPHAINVGCEAGRKRCYRIPREDVLDYINDRKEGC